MQVLEGEGRLSLGNFLGLQTYLPLIFFSSFRTLLPPWIKRHTIFATAEDFNNIVYLLIMTFDTNNTKNSSKKTLILWPQ